MLLPACLLAAEGIFRWFDWGDPGAGIIDPGFSGANSLFVKSEAGDHYEIRPSRQRFFAPESFPATKAPNEFRIFCLGGSTVQGRPYGIETSFTTWLELGLTAADPQRKWEVVNCGGVSYASFRLIPVLEECLSYQPDLIVLCTGHNEFLEERTFAIQRNAPRPLNWLNEFLLRSRVFGWLQGFSQPARRDASVTLTNDVDAFLDHPNGLDAYHRNPAWQTRVITEFDVNVRTMLAMAERARVPLILMLPPSNLRDSPPFKSEHANGLAAPKLSHWSNLVAQATSFYNTNLSLAVTRLREALSIDGSFAQTHYSLGKCYEAQGLARPAREAFLQAREQDICPLRILAPMESALERAAHDFDVPLFDAHERLERDSRWNILGNDQLVDHVHPSIRSHQLLADALLGMMIQDGRAEPQPDWKSRQSALTKQHFKTLGDLYYVRGQQRLENLRAWTQGRAQLPHREQGEQGVGPR